MKKMIDLSHPLEDGMAVFPGLPRPRIGAFLSHEESRPHYQERAEFHLAWLEMPGSLGTYLDSPFHRHRTGADLSGLELDRLAGLPGIVLEGRPAADRSLTLQAPAKDLAGRAVLIRTGWDRRWGREEYWQPGPYLSAAALDQLIAARAGLVGVDFSNVDDLGDPSRPAHTRLLAEGILIVENLTRLDLLPEKGFRFFAVPPRIVGGSSFPVRAFAELEAEASV